MGLSAEEDIASKKASFAVTLSIWWLIVWRNAVGGFAIAFLVGFSNALIGRALGLSPGIMTWLKNISLILVFIIWGFFVVKMALRKQYKNFEILIIRRTPNEAVKDPTW